jgi:hypothetical protein
MQDNKYNGNLFSFHNLLLTTYVVVYAQKKFLRFQIYCCFRKWKRVQYAQISCGFIYAVSWGDINEGSPV